MNDAYDVVVVGGGIAGISAAYALGQDGARVAVVEREATLTAHSTGRSAAQFLASYGEPANRRLSAASRAFLDSDADGLADSAVLIPRNVLWVAPDGFEGHLQERIEANQVTVTECELLDVERTVAICAALDPEWLAGGVIEYGGFDIDVAGLHQAYVRGARAEGVTILRERGVRELRQQGSDWRVETSEGRLSCSVVVNAAGAWADELAAVAGAQAVGMRPLRRTIFTFSTSFDAEDWPLVIAADESFYFKPEGPGQLLGSPADEHLDGPCDARPREVDVARGIEAVNQATRLDIRSIRSKWAGLRTFAPDRVPVVGFDPVVPGFFWCAGQGGTGIQTAPAISTLAAALISGENPPEDVAALASLLSPQRFAGVAAVQLEGP
ncbi:MAG: FAD-binding oxidoreductase [Acidimicrobiales bacterium]|nr:FAD-binding oxidoreductase [Acidimicrobiales bacterium]MYD34762.1 FAD-binding oxidoreductase [Acidimicrobiales bacterium]MYI10307.1 FAD-binding oxidoreductase [Acidimicrobiales bacterium]